MISTSKPPAVTRRAALRLGLATATLAATAPAVFAASVESYVANLGRQVMSLARSGQSGAVLKRRFVALLTRSANMKSIARFALGKYLRKMPRGMQNEYYRLVLDYIAGLFVYYRKDLAGRELRVKKKIKRGKWITVDSDIIFPGGQKSPVKWRIYAGGRYRVGDVNIQGIWLSIRMRDKFVSILDRSKGDFTALMRYLRENAA